MNNDFEIDCYNINETMEVKLKDIPMYINIPDSIEERNVYKVDTKEQFTTIKPKKFGGLTYRIIEYVDEFAKIKTVNFGECLIKITKTTTITNYPVYESGCY